MTTTTDVQKKIEDKAPAKVDKIRSLLEAHQKQFELALAGTVNTDKFVRVALTEIRRNSKLGEASVPSLLGALLASAQLGLEPGGPLGHAYLVPYGKEVQLIVSYKGMEQLAYRSGIVASINARVVREGDSFDFEFGSNEYIRHIPKAGVGGEVTHAYCIARLVTGGQVMVVLFREDIERRKGRSKATGKGSPWDTDYDEMARKSAIRAIFRDLPASTETQRALGYDERQFTSPEDADLAEDIIDVEEVEA
jgi:recombination protein RecT